MYDQLEKDARSTFVSLFMDGRNDHGTHLFEMNTHSVPSDMMADLCDEYLNPKSEIAEIVFQSAEDIGFVSGSVVTAILDYTLDDGGIDGYFEFARISETLTMLFWGSAAEQAKRLSDTLPKEAMK